MNKYQACVDFLVAAGAQIKRHSSRTLLIHLERTYRILESAGQPEHVCYAGLMHSIYGTSAFKSTTVNINDREKVQELIGDTAENLAWQFCQLERPSALIAFINGETALPYKDGNGFWKIESELDIRTANELLAVESANLLDQQVLWQNQWLVPFAQSAGLLTDDGYCILRTSDAYKKERAVELGWMLDAARQGTRNKLIRKINEFRAQHATSLIGGEDVRKLKLHQAILYSEAQKSGNIDALEESQISLILNYAKAYNRSIDDAVNLIFDSCSKHENVLLSTEILKDKISGQISLAMTLSEIDEIRKGIDLLSFSDLQ